MSTAVHDDTTPAEPETPDEATPVTPDEAPAAEPETPTVDPEPETLPAVRDGNSFLSLTGHSVFEWTTTQKAALKAIINFDPNEDNGWAHIEAFLHSCYTAGLDPFNREAYLIKRGTKEKAKYTAQTGIDGFRKMAASSGRFVRVRDRLWTGREDDDSAYWRDDNGVMRRKWYDVWPERLGYPGAAKVVVEHYDDQGILTTTEAVGNWEMFVAVNEVWAGEKPNRRPTGEKVVADMWQKGGPHMLSKCVEALAHRLAFPARMRGFYLHEEMTRLDAEERNRRAEDAAEKRRAAFRRSQAAVEVTVEREPEPAEPEPPVDPAAGMDAPGVPVGVVDPEPEPAAPAPEQPPAAPEPAPSPAPAEAPAEPEPDPVADAQQREWLDAELAAQAAIMHVSAATMVRRHTRQRGVPWDDFPLDARRDVVVGLREAVQHRLTTEGKGEQAAAYRAAGDAVAPLDVLGLA